MDIFKISEYNQQLAWEVLEESNIIPISVLSNKIGNYKEFIQWRESNSLVNTIQWLP